MTNWKSRKHRNQLKDGQTFNELASPASRSKLRSIPGAAKRLNRATYPLRGWAVKFSNQPEILEDMYQQLLQSYIDHIKESDLPEEVKQSLITWESFQSKQKGPVGPLNGEKSYPDGIKKIKENNRVVFNLSADLLLEIRGFADAQVKYFNEYDPTVKRADEIDFLARWAELPGSTVRGFPFNDLGRNVDEQIITEIGAGLDNALTYLEAAEKNWCFHGFRMQGKPYGEGAKLRFVFIPTVFYQWINVGLYKESMDRLKKSPTFAGWQDPVERNRTITTLLEESDKAGYHVLALDFSGFDTNISPDLRSMANAIMLTMFDSGQWKNRYKVQQDKLNIEQYLLAYDGGKVASIHVPNQLLSGTINTQHDGSLINLMIQQYVASRLGYQLPLRFALALGDDVGIPVPKSILEGKGYYPLLTEISNIVKDFGMTIHDKKVYPTDQLIFLQKLWDLKQNIIETGSWMRSLSSLLYSENWPKPIKGVKSLAALEILAGISILEQGFSKSIEVHNDFAQIIADWWLTHDDGLIYLREQVSNAQSKSDALFRVLVEMIGGYDNLITYLNKQSYDHTGLSQLSEVTDYGKVFKILNYIINSSVPYRPIDKEFVKRYFEDVSYFVDEAADDLVKGM